MSAHKKLLGSGVGLDLAVMAAPVLALVTTVVTARFLGAQWRGAIAVYSAWGQLLGVVALMGLDRGLVATARDRAWPRATVEALHAALARRLVPALAVAALVASVVVRLSTKVWWLAGLVMVLTVVAGIIEWRAALALALGRWERYKLFRVVQPLVYASGATALALLAPGQQQVDLAQWVAVVLVASYLCEFWVLPRSRRGFPEASDLAETRRIGSEFWPTGAAMQASARVGLFLAPAVLTLPEVGLLSAAMAPAGALAAVSGAVLARSLAGVGEGRFPVRHWLAVCALAMLAALVMPIAIPLVFGQEFTPAVRSAQVLLMLVASQYVIAWGAGRLAGQGMRGSLLPQLTTILGTVVFGSLLGRSLAGYAVGVVLASAGGALATIRQVRRASR